MRGPHAPAASERGVALLLAIFFTIIITGLVFAGTIMIKTHRAENETRFRLHGQAAQFARAGLTDALGWFRKSKTQPVAQFTPTLDPGASPPLLETMDPDIGIVREFQINGPVWGRYEAHSVIVALGYDAPHSPASRSKSRITFANHRSFESY